MQCALCGCDLTLMAAHFSPGGALCLLCYCEQRDYPSFCDDDGDDDDDDDYYDEDDLGGEG